MVSLNHLHEYDVYANGRSLRHLLSACTWEENPGEIASRASIVLALEDYVDQSVLTDLMLRQPLTIIADERDTVFHGLVWEWDYDLAEPTQLTVVAMAPTYYLTRSKENYQFLSDTVGGSVTVFQALAEIMTDWNVPIGIWEFQDAPIVNKTIFNNERLADIVYDLLESSRFVHNEEFFVRSNGNALDVVKPGSNPAKYTFTSRNTNKIRGHWDMNDLVTRVKIYTGVQEEGNSLSNVIDNADLIDHYGVMQEILALQQFGSIEDAADAAQEIFSLRGEPRHYQRVIAPDVPTVRKGDQHYFDTGPAQGWQTVGGVHHDALTGLMTMELGTPEFKRSRSPLKPTIAVHEDPAGTLPHGGGAPDSTGLPPPVPAPAGP